MKSSALVKNEALSKLFRIADGLLGTATDIILFSLFFGFEASMAGYGRVYKAESKVYDDLSEFNYKTIKKTISNLKSKGLVEVIKHNGCPPQITEAGRERLLSLIPQYDSKRVWDHKTYMVTYDIPVSRNNQRDKLRAYLKKIGCGLLQESVWITPYNPKKLIEDFVTESKMENNLIIISSIGKDGTIGDLDNRDLVESVYNLSEINERYNNFISWAKSEKHTRSQVISKYLLILKDDPQVPFELLPDDWVGDEAYKIYRSVV